MKNDMPLSTMSIRHSDALGSHYSQLYFLAAQGFGVLESGKAFLGGAKRLQTQCLHHQMPAVLKHNDRKPGKFSTGSQPLLDRPSIPCLCLSCTMKKTYLKIMKASWAQWCMPAIPAPWEAEKKL